MTEPELNKACAWLEKYMESLGYIDEWCRNGEDTFRKAMAVKESLITAGNDAESRFIDKACDAYCQVCGHYPHKVPTHICRQDCDYYMEFRKAVGAVVKESLTPELTWQDVQKIVEIADAMIDKDVAGELPEHLATPKAYYTEILKRFKEIKGD